MIPFLSHKRLSVPNSTPPYSLPLFPPIRFLVLALNHVFCSSSCSRSPGSSIGYPPGQCKSPHNVQKVLNCPNPSASEIEQCMAFRRFGRRPRWRWVLRLLITVRLCSCSWYCRQVCSTGSKEQGQFCTHKGGLSKGMRKLWAFSRLISLTKHFERFTTKLLLFLKMNMTVRGFFSSFGPPY